MTLYVLHKAIRLIHDYPATQLLKQRIEFWYVLENNGKDENGADKKIVGPSKQKL